MRSLAYSARAENDLDAIFDYSVESWGLERAVRYLGDLRAACESLARGDRAGREVSGRNGLRRHVVRSHIIYFRHHGARVDIIRILHGAQGSERNL